MGPAAGFPRVERVEDERSGLAAAARGDVARLQVLVGARSGAAAPEPPRRQWDPAAAVDRHGSTALTWAAGGGHLAACRYLLEDCAVPVDARNKARRTAFHWAVRGDHLEVCQLLLREGADPGATMKDGSQALDWAMFYGSLRTADWLVDALGCDLRGTNNTGCTPLHWAAAGGQLAACQWLWARGADFGVRNTHLHGCLNKACWKGHTRVVEWLLSAAPAGPEVAAQLLWLDLDGRSLAQVTRMGGHEDLALKLERLAAAMDGAAAGVPALPLGSSSCSQSALRLHPSRRPRRTPLGWRALRWWRWLGCCPCAHPRCVPCDGGRGAHKAQVPKRSAPAAAAGVGAAGEDVGATRA